MALWCEKLPVVTVPQGETPKRVTLVYPYYECGQFFQHQMRHWMTLSQRHELFGQFSVVVVDDGSPTVPATAAVESIRASRDSFYLPRLFRIDVDVPWNWLAARNIGAHHAVDGWLLLTDMDHVVPAETLRSVVYGQHDPNVVYAFSRREHTGETIHPHSASFLMTKAMFWKIGGYDETLSGVYGTDGLYRKRLAAKAPIHVLTDVLVRHEYVDDSSTTQFERKTDRMAAEKHRKMAHVGPVPKTLSFPYREVVA